MKLLPKGIANSDKVIEGLINTVKLNHGRLSEEEVNEIVRRRLICNSCPFNSLLAKESQEYFDIFKEHYQSSREDLHCSVCSCNIDLATTTFSKSCGLDTDDKTLHLPLKWDVYGV